MSLLDEARNAQVSTWMPETAAIVSGFTHQPKGAHVACEHKRIRPKEAAATPPAFRDVLLAMARSAATVTT